MEHKKKRNGFNKSFLPCRNNTCYILWVKDMVNKWPCLSQSDGLSGCDIVVQTPRWWCRSRSSFANRSLFAWHEKLTFNSSPLTNGRVDRLYYVLEHGPILPQLTAKHLTLWIIPAECRCFIPHNIWYSRYDIRSWSRSICMTWHKLASISSMTR